MSTFPKSLHFVVNPNAGKKQGLAVAEAAQRTLETAEIKVITHVSTYPGHAVELAARIVEDRLCPPSGVIAVGGDGTLFEVINGLIRGFAGGQPGVTPSRETPLPCPVGQIPVGTGNSFIRDLGIQTPEDALDAICADATRLVDLGVLTCDAGRFHFVNLLGAGFVSNVAHRAARYKRWGALSYVFGVLQETIALAPSTITLTIDGTTIHRTGLFVEICNSRCTGGTMQMAPDAQVDDGLLDVIILHTITRRKILRLFPRIFSGTHIEDPVVEVIRGRSIRVVTETPWLLTPDGETFGSTPVQVEVIPRSIRVFGR